MWILEPIQPPLGTSAPTVADGFRTYWLLGGQEYRIGRGKDCEIVLEADKSISRLHAYLSVDVLNGSHVSDTKSRQRIRLTEKSRFGTTLNGSKVREDETESLTDGDAIHFGIYSLRFRLRWHKVHFCWSRIPKEQQTELVQIALRVGAHHLPEVTALATHLVVDEVGATEKVALALILGIPIVGLTYFKAMAEKGQAQIALPAEAVHLPPVSSEWDNFLEHSALETASFRANPARRTLFKGINFTFLKEDLFNQTRELVKLASGACILDTGSTINKNFAVKHRGSLVVLESGAEEAPTSAGSGTTPATQIRRALEELRCQVKQGRGFGVITNRDILSAILMASPASLRNKIRCTTDLDSQIEAPEEPIEHIDDPPPEAEAEVDEGGMKPHRAVKLEPQGPSFVRPDAREKGGEEGSEATLTQDTVRSSQQGKVPDASFGQEVAQIVAPLRVLKREEVMPCYLWPKDQKPPGKGKVFKKQGLLAGPGAKATVKLRTANLGDAVEGGANLNKVDLLASSQSTPANDRPDIQFWGESEEHEPKQAPRRKPSKRKREESSSQATNTSPTGEEGTSQENAINLFDDSESESPLPKRAKNQAKKKSKAKVMDSSDEEESEEPTPRQRKSPKGKAKPKAKQKKPAKAKPKAKPKAKAKGKKGGQKKVLTKPGALDDLFESQKPASQGKGKEAKAPKKRRGEYINIFCEDPDEHEVESSIRPDSGRYY